MKTTLSLIIISLFLSSPLGYAEEPEVEIKIFPQDQTCEKDEDCTVVETSCVRAACECGGKPINKKHKEKYEMLVSECREASQSPIIFCDMDCPASVEKCANNECIIFQTDSNRAPSHKASEIRVKADEIAQSIGRKDLNKYKEPATVFIPDSKKWELFYASKESRDTDANDYVSNAKNNFYVVIDDETLETGLMVP